LADFSESSENVENTDSLISNGISYDLWIAWNSLGSVWKVMCISNLCLENDY
jgi:hypothetical protein